ncbi:MAG: hypothetical protein ACK2T2_08250 [Anaerolineales bacterium]
METLFIVWAFLFQVLLIIHFSLRKWHFELVERYGWSFYTLGIPGLAISIILFASGMSWSFWLGGVLQFVWSGFGYYVEFVQKIRWRNPPYWRVLWPYVTLYLATNMFYWWPQDLLDRRLWFAYGGLFILSTILNVTSHRKDERQRS